MKKSKNYELLFRKNPKSGRIIIDIALGDYLEFFDEWDNSTFKKRDMHPELGEFLNLCSDDIPIRKKIEIALTVDEDEGFKEKEDMIRTSFKNYYSALKRTETRNIKRHVRISLISLFTALILLTLYIIFIDTEANTIVSKVLLESLLIGGWVFAWEAVHLMFIDIFSRISRRREINRLLEAEISFFYKGKRQNE